MMRLWPSRWRSIVIRTAVFVVVLIALRVAFTTNAISSRLSYLPNHAVAEAYPSVPPDIESLPGTIRMMVVGDSISQGGEGDWTWRYRLWEWFKDQQVTVDFVGPFLGTRPQAVHISFDEVIIPEPLGLPPTGDAITTAVSLLKRDSSSLRSRKSQHPLKYRTLSAIFSARFSENSHSARPRLTKDFFT